MLGVEAVAERMADHVVGQSPDDARHRQDGAGRRRHPPPRRQFACVHDDNPPVSMQDRQVQLGHVIRQDPLSMAPGIPPKDE